jgi:hypothetical protein
VFDRKRQKQNSSIINDVPIVSDKGDCEAMYCVGQPPCHEHDNKCGVTVHPE